MLEQILLTKRTSNRWVSFHQQRLLGRTGQTKQLPQGGLYINPPAHYYLQSHPGFTPPSWKHRDQTLAVGVSSKSIMLSTPTTQVPATPDLWFAAPH